MNKKYSIALFIFIFVLALSGVATSQGTPQQPTLITPPAQTTMHTTDSKSGGKVIAPTSNSDKDAAVGQQVCTTAMSTVRDNVQAQLTSQNVIRAMINTTEPDFVYKSTDFTHCVVQSQGFTPYISI